jgi:hypothetical protein
MRWIQGGKGKGKAKGQQHAAAYQQLDGTGKSQVRNRSPKNGYSESGVHDHWVSKIKEYIKQGKS